jgi:phosphate transport system protein
MCGLAADAMEHATQALLGSDLSVAEQVIADHEHIEAMSKRAEASALKLLALQQPVAGDLRTIVGAIHVGADIERMGALAVHVARIARLRHPECAVPDEVRDSFSEMGTQSVQLARTAREVMLSGDPEKAARLRDADDAVDAEHRHLFTMLIDHVWQDGVCSAVDVALLGRFYERFADHAVEIGRRVVFETTGGLPDHKKMA